VWTAIPAILPSSSSHSPVCKPARTSRPSALTPSTIPCAQRIARAGNVEAGDEAVASRVDLAPTQADELPPHDGVGPLRQSGPSSVAKLGGWLGGADDVREEDRCEHAIGLGLVPGPGFPGVA